eukprot:1417595-Rhodomonas_salina.1
MKSSPSLRMVAPTDLMISPPPSWLWLPSRLLCSRIPHPDPFIVIRAVWRVQSTTGGEILPNNTDHASSVGYQQPPTSGSYLEL